MTIDNNLSTKTPKNPNSRSYLGFRPSSTIMSSKPKKKWQKTLYGNEGYPDNFTDHSFFLKDLEKNKNVKFFTFFEAVSGTSRLNHQISCITLFLITFDTMYRNRTEPETMFLCTIVTTIFGYLLYLWNRYEFSIIFQDLKIIFTVLIFGYILSPMLHTLTNSISTDTIFTVTFFVFILHLIFFDYGLPAFLVSKAISLNAAIFGSICLASRLATSFHAFTLLTISADFFVLLPILVQTYWTPWQMLPMSICCIYLLNNISQIVLVIYLLVLITVNLICPYIFVYNQKFKSNIHGPWDEAIVKETVIIEQ